MNSSAFYNALIKRPNERTDEDVSIIFNHLRRLDVFDRLNDAPLRSVCRTARLEKHPANYVLFRKGQLATCWYILLAGSVFMNNQVYMPIGCFGKRSNMNLRRMSDCIVISPSDMIVIDYPDVQRITVHLNNNGNESVPASTSNSYNNQTIPNNSHNRHQHHSHQQPGISASTAFPPSVQMLSSSASSATAVPFSNISATPDSATLKCQQQKSRHVGNQQQQQRMAPGSMQRFPIIYSPAIPMPAPPISPHYQHQQQLIFHRFPLPTPPLIPQQHTAFLATSSHHHQLPPHLHPNTAIAHQQQQKQQVSIANSSSSFSTAITAHRVPSPAPPTSVAASTLSTLTTYSSLAKQQQSQSNHVNQQNLTTDHQPPKHNHHHRHHQYPVSTLGPANNLHNHHHHTNNQQHQHVKSNSMSETATATTQSGGGGLLHSYEIEVPFMRAKTIEEEQFSPPRPPRTQPLFVRTMASGAVDAVGNPPQSKSLIQQKKTMFEGMAAATAAVSSTLLPGSTSAHPQPQNSSLTTLSEDDHLQQQNNGSQQTSTLKRREQQEEMNSNDTAMSTKCSISNNNIVSTLSKLRKNEKQTAAEKMAEPRVEMPQPSNFQRLNKLRRNMANNNINKKLNSNAGNTHDSNENVNIAQQMMTNVRIRQPSPSQMHRKQQGGSQQLTAATTINRIRQSITSGTSANTGDEPDCFAGLPETAVDSEGPEDDEEEEEEDEEEGSCPSHDSFQELRDNVRECLEKDPAHRTDEDLAILIDFMASLPALTPLPMGIKRQLCGKMVFAVVPERGTTIMQHGERIDAWSVVINGSVEHVHSNGHRVEYRVGESFGVQPIAQAQYMDGEIRTLADECEFVLVEHGDFYSIMSTLSRHIERADDDNGSGEIVREVERRMVDNHVELVIVKASPDRLLHQLLVDDELFVAAVAATGTASPNCGSDIAAAQLDTHFVEDFLLMYRVFFPDPTLVVRQLIDWFRSEPKHRDRVARIMLIWLNNHFEDFERNDSSSKMQSLLNKFDELLSDAKMYNHQSLLSITCSVKSQPRQITMTRSDRAEPLDFQLVGGTSPGGIFVQYVDVESSAAKMGLRRGDEILEVNGQNFQKFSLTKAEELIRESTHLSITLKTNWIGFKEAQNLQQEDQIDSAGPVFRPNANSPVGTTATLIPSRYQKKCSAPMMGAGNGSNQQQRERRCTLTAALNQTEFKQQQPPFPPSQSVTPHGTIGSATACSTVSSKKVLNKLLHMIRGNGGGAAGTGNGYGSGNHLTLMDDIHANNHQQQMTDSADEMPMSLGVGHSTLRASRSNPDISTHSLNAGGSCLSAAFTCSSSHRHSSLCANNSVAGCSTSLINAIQADQVLKVYRSDQSFRYIPVCAETSAKQLVHLSLQEFGIPIDTNGSGCCWWALYECSVSRDGVIKQRRLPEAANNLAERVGLNARLYLRDLQKGDSTLLPDELIPEVLKQARLTLYTLNAQCIATQLTLQDFAVFASIGPIEYVNHLFQLADADDDNPCFATSTRHKGWSHLAEFEALFNQEMWWVATEVCCERNVYRRSKLVKKFIKIARHCHLLRNLNSMFAIVSGLGKPAVQRLAHTWERVPGKYLKMLADLQQLMDPTRNMSHYRQHLAQLAQEPPVIPIYPILRKDLTFAHEANPTFCGPRLVNFEKLRMIAQIVRGIQRLSSVHYDPMELLCGVGGGNTAITGMAFQSSSDGNNFLEPGTIRKAGGVATSTAATMMAGIMASRFGSSGGSANAGGTGAGMSRKKLYERTLMLRRVRAYLQAMPIIDSEIELDRISLECEPPALASMQSASVQQLHHNHNQQHPISSSSTSTARRRMPSPSPSSLSSQSNQSGGTHSHRSAGGMMMGFSKFGVESPQAVQKMLSLVQNSKIKARQQHQHINNQHHHPNRSAQLHQSCGALSASAELPPICFERKRSSIIVFDSNNSSNNSGGTRSNAPSISADSTIDENGNQQQQQNSVTNNERAM